MRPNDEDLLGPALAYAARGWSIVPVRFLNGRKAGAVRWRPFQKTAPGPDVLAKWFAPGKYPALGVILGPVSGNLAARDFDDADAYHRWAKDHPDLAAALPTVTTGRGYHVYFMAPVPKTMQYIDGELRGAKSLCVLPPSRHPKGGRYAWLVSVGDGPPPTIDPEAAGLVGEPVKQKQAEASGSEPKGTEAVRSRLNAGSVGGAGDEDVELAIVSTLPTGTGQRNRAVLQLARALKGLPQYAQAPAQALRPVVERWHALALPVIGTKDFEETWIDFLYCWPRIRRPMRLNLMDDALRAARSRPVAGCGYGKAELVDLVSLCRDLQGLVGPGEPFFLSARTVGRLFGVAAPTAWRWLFLLGEEGWIKAVQKGDARRATRFVWTGDGRGDEAKEKRGTGSES